MVVVVFDHAYAYDYDLMQSLGSLSEGSRLRRLRRSLENSIAVLPKWGLAKDDSNIVGLSFRFIGLPLRI